jgi:hypothetical protein
MIGLADAFYIARDAARRAFRRSWVRLQGDDPDEVLAVGPCVVQRGDMLTDGLELPRWRLPLRLRRPSQITVRAYRAGYWAALDRATTHIQALDPEDMTANQVRVKLYKDIINMKPPEWTA